MTARPQRRRPRIRMLRIRWPRVQLPPLRYNPAKGLSGQTQADLVNTLAAVMGLGAAPELGDAVAWFWAGGIVIGLLTLGVAFFQWRRARQEAAPHPWYALTMATTVVGLFTIASNAVAAGLEAARNLSASLAWFGAIGIAIGLLILAAAFFQWRRARRKDLPGIWYALSLVTAGVGLFTIAFSVVAIVMAVFKPQNAGVVAGMVGWPAFLAWMAAEAVNVYENLVKKPKTGPSNTSLLKSMCQIVGALLIWIFVIMAFAFAVTRSRYDASLVSWLFWIGAGLAFLGTDLGMLAGLWNLRRKPSLQRK
jgi:hypothetical protein